MSRLDDDLSRYFTALDRRESAHGDRAYPTSGAPLRSDRRRLALLVAAGAVLVAAIAGVLLVRDSSESSYVEVPEGWQTVTFGTIQFGVPADWPLYTDVRCWDGTADGVYVGGGTLGACPETGWDLRGVLIAAAAIPTGGESNAHWHGTLNGLRADAQWPSPAIQVPGQYPIIFGDEGILLSIELGPSADMAVVRQVIETIGPAADPQVVPTTTRVPQTTTTEAPVITAYCEAVERSRSGPLTDPATGDFVPGALPSVRAILEVAPEELRPPYQTVVAWLEEGATGPQPVEVDAAAGEMMRDWMNRCNGR
jgi:hypothetical protein